MAWQGISGHDAIVEQFRRSLSRGRLASTYLFVGPEGVGKRSFAERLAQTLLCPEREVVAMAPCGVCPSCRQVVSGSHPDLLTIEKPADRNVLPIELLVGSRDHRMQQGLCHDIGLKPFMGRRRVAIIDDAEHLNEESANCLLKTLEEPPPFSLLILCATSEEQVLSTIRSRCQMIRFRGLPTDVVADLIVKQGIVTERSAAERLAEYAEGSLGRARDVADGGLWEFRGKLLAALARGPIDAPRLSVVVAKFIDQAGREAVARRHRARYVVRFTIEFYRALTRSLCGATPATDHELSAAVEQAVSHFSAGVDAAVSCVDRSLEALDHIGRYAHQSAWLECWLNDLAEHTRGVGSAV